MTGPGARPAHARAPAPDDRYPVGPRQVRGAPAGHRGAVAVRVGAEESVQVHGPPAERRALGRIPVVVVPVVEVEAVEGAAGHRGRLPSAHRVLEGVIAVNAVGRVGGVRLQRAEVVADLVPDDVGTAEIAAVAEDQRELAAEVVQVRLAAGGVEQGRSLSARARRARAVEPDEEVLVQGQELIDGGVVRRDGEAAFGERRCDRVEGRGPGSGREPGELRLGERQPHLGDVELPGAARGADVEPDRACVLVLEQGRRAEGILLELGADRCQTARPVRGIGVYGVVAVLAFWNWLAAGSVFAHQSTALAAAEACATGATAGAPSGPCVRCTTCASLIAGAASDASTVIPTVMTRWAAMLPHRPRHHPHARAGSPAWTDFVRKRAMRPLRTSRRRPARAPARGRRSAADRCARAPRTASGRPA